ncbi:hypothetical protein ABPG72_010713, partial [Tetrahymena utriculariae]
MSNSNQSYEEELQILQQIKGIPNTYQLIDSFQSEIKTVYIQIFKRYQSDLKNVMQNVFKLKEAFPLNSIIGIGLKMSQTLEIIKSKKIFYSDLKPLNILYDNVDKCFDLCDFGAAKIIQKRLVFYRRCKQIFFQNKQYQLSLDIKIKLKAANRIYLAPEFYDNNSQGIRVQYDVYCLGLILHEMTIGKQNNISDKDAKDIENSLEESLNVNSLSLFLNQNNFSLEGAKRISNCLLKFPNITQLRLGL